MAPTSFYGPLYQFFAFIMNIPLLEMNVSIAILLTCHNRKNKTLACLSALVQTIKPKNYVFDIFLVDDGSIDGTAEAVKASFPEVIMINGTGNLFWNQGMRLAWQNAIENKKDYDFFLWLNDDSYLNKDSLVHLFDCYYENKINKESIIVGSCQESVNSKSFSYGLRLNENVIEPNGSLQFGNIMNGNVVLIPLAIYARIGMLSKNYTHAMGDHDYGLRAIEAGFDLITTKKYIAICRSHKDLPNWCNPKLTFQNRWRYLHSPSGLNIKEYKIFIKRFWPENYFISLLKVYFRCFFPNIYTKIKNNGQ